MAQAVDKQQVHDLIEQMTPEQLSTAASFLKSMLDVNVDDEPVTEGDRQAILRSEAWFKERGGRGIPMKEVLADFGLTMDDFPLKDHGSDSHD
jgi:hypothetical protein